MQKQLENLLFSEFRYIVAEADDKEITNESLAKAVTVNENITSYGFTLLPSDVVSVLGKMNHPEGVYEKIKAFLPGVQAKPMYPDFPNQVLEMSEAQFRFHQIMHYDSTYGTEARASLLNLLFETDENVTVSKGWLPAVSETEKTKKDAQLLPLKTLEVLSTKDVYTVPFVKILSKRERMTAKEEQIIHLICTLSPESVIESLPIAIPFKENLASLTDVVLELEDTKTTLEIMSEICAHTGDVLKCLKTRLKGKKYHLSRPEKRKWVTLFEMYSEADLACNLMLSGKKARKNISALQFIDFNRYSKSAAHKEVVRKFRNGELFSWESELKKTLEMDVQKGVEYASKRPGNLLRMLTWFLRLGAEPEALQNALTANAGALSTQTLLDVLNYFCNESFNEYNGRAVEENEENPYENEKKEAGNILKAVLREKLKTIETPLKQERESSEKKKVFIKPGVFELSRSKMLGNTKSAEGGYLRKGLAIKIPEDIKNIRMFTYWNDANRVDVDLHAMGDKKDGETIHTGWNSSFKCDGLVFSGDITHSDAAEYIDVNIDEAVKNKVARIFLSIDLYWGQPTFKEIDTCFSGIMGVSNLNDDVKLYDPKNCIYSFNNTAKCRTERLGVFYPEQRILELDLSNQNSYTQLPQYHTITFSMLDYLTMLIEEQNAQLGATEEDADIILTIEKAESEKECSLTDCNYFMDC